MIKILIVFGTRPEFIKLLPIIIYLKKIKKLNLFVCNTGQHKELLKPFLDFYNIKIDFNLKTLKNKQNLSELSSVLFKKIDKLYFDLKPKYVVVQGDTSSSFISSIVAFYNQIKVFHIEAGLRTNNIYFPWPEEVNRQFISKISYHHFAPSINAKKNLIYEGVASKNITLVGNTVIDTLFITLEILKKNKSLLKQIKIKTNFLNKNKFNILITAHRRENFGKNISEILKAIDRISKYNNVNIIYSHHKNEILSKKQRHILNSNKNIFSISNVDYNEFVYIMKNIDLIMSDSGGIQEEAPSLGKPLIILRYKTERIEAVKKGSAILVKPKCDNIVEKFDKIYSNKRVLNKMSIKRNLYGKGNSAQKICKKIINLIF